MKLETAQPLSTRWQEVELILQKSSSSLSNVLIMGETKAVRLVIAFSFHNRGRTAQMPFLATECGAFVNDLRQKLAEKMGSERRDQRELSSSGWGISGTTFLDGADELSIGEQKLLLEFVKERERRRFPASSTSVGRLIAGSTRNLEDLCRLGKFLPELYDCLNKVKVNLMHSPDLKLVK